MKRDLQRFMLPESLLQKSIYDLSGGEYQRVSLIRNLQFVPQVLLLDEVTSALDEENKHNVNEIIRQLGAQQKMAVLWVTHDRDEIAHADDIIELQAHQARETANEPA